MQLNKFTKIQNRIRAKREAGVVLGMAELIAVIVVGGIIAASGAALYTDVFKMADASFLYNTADRLNSGWRLGATKCGVSSQIGVSPITTTVSAAAHLTLLVEGTGTAAAYTGCWNSAGIEPANTAGIKGTAGAYKAQSYTMTISNVAINGRNRVAVTYALVEEATALEIVQKYGNQAGAAALSALPAAADTTDNKVRYGAAASGYRDVTIIM